MSSEARSWTRRLRWRLRGAWQWPAFGVLTALDALILHLLPPTRLGVDPVPALILASFGNLFLVGVVAPWLSRRLVERDRRTSPPGATPELPAEVVLDRTATGLLAAGTVAVVAAGLAARPLVVSETEATERVGSLVRDHVLADGTDEVRRNLETANTIRLEEGYFRTCVALDDRTRAFCMFVDTDESTVTEDPSPTPNALFFGERGRR